jgi:sugar lactone lactonase YvrE
VFNDQGQEISVIAPPETLPLNRKPLYVVVDREGTVYVSDRTHHAIDIYGADGSYQGRFAPGGNENFPWSPMAMAFGPQGNLYVTDVTRGWHRVMVFDPRGKLLREFGSEGNDLGQLSFPNGIAVDASGRIFVADSNNFRIQIFRADGTPLGQFGQVGAASVGLPRGLALDDQGRFYIVDVLGHRIISFYASQAMEHLFTVGKMGSGDGEFSYPNGLAIDGTGRVYITDRENNRLQVWSY